jgi:hypothetical protein
MSTQIGNAAAAAAAAAPCFVCAAGWQFNQATNRATRVTTESGFVAYTLPYANPNPNTAGDRIIQQ